MFPRETYRMGTGLLLLLGCINCLSLVEGQRLAVRKCEEYRTLAIKKHIQHLLILFHKSIDIESNICTNDVQQITLGEKAKYGEFPHHALLGYPQKDGSIRFKCGGTLISDQHVMTAAHCFKNENPTVVRLGEYDTTFATGEEYEDDIAAYRTHPDFKFPLFYHDIALVKLANRVQFSKLIRPACLWDSKNRNTTQYIAIGFGVNDSLSAALSTKMKKMPLVEVPAEDCNGQLIRDRRFPSGLLDGQLCIGSLVHNITSCQGDGGGSLQTVISSNPCMYVVVGIISVGDGWCGHRDKEVHTKVSRYLDWIEDNVWGSNAS